MLVQALTAANGGDLLWDAHLLQVVLCLDHIRTLDYVSKQATAQVASVQEQQLLRTARDQRDGSMRAWVEATLFPLAVLRCWPAGDHRYKLGRRKRQRAECDSVFNRLQDWQAAGPLRDELIREILRTPEPDRSSRHFSELQKRRRALKLAREVGQFRKAVQALLSHGVAVFDDKKQVLETLRRLHPQGALPTMPPGWCPPEEGIVIDNDGVLAALRSFPKGTACGRSGLRAAHLLQMSGALPAYLTTLTSVVAGLAKGSAPKEFAPFLASAPLVPLLKPDGKSIRPIAIGEILRRLVSKVLLRAIRHRAA